MSLPHVRGGPFWYLGGCSEIGPCVGLRCIQLCYVYYVGTLREFVIVADVFGGLNMCWVSSSTWPHVVVYPCKRAN